MLFQSGYSLPDSLAQASSTRSARPGRKVISCGGATRAGGALLTGGLEIMSAVLIAPPASRIVGLALGAVIIAAAVMTVLRHRDLSHLVPLSVFVAFDCSCRDLVLRADIANQTSWPLFCRVVRKPDILLSPQFGRYRL
jgi:hypothetical protein